MSLTRLSQFGTQITMCRSKLNVLLRMIREHLQINLSSISLMVNFFTQIRYLPGIYLILINCYSGWTKTGI